MGIKHFFPWFKKTYPECIRELNNRNTLPEQKVDIDSLGIDLNGVFHPVAQRVYKYGAHAPLQSFLRKKERRLTVNDKRKLDRKFYMEVCKEIEKIVDYVRPTKRLILCIDGIAGFSKQSQQRGRRFKSGKENTCTQFDSCSLTPGTELMHYLSFYIDYYIRKKIQSDSYWESLIITFSSEKVEGEGEQKIKYYMKDYCGPDEACVIYGLDADIIMLSLSLHKSKMYVLRENMFAVNQHFCIDVSLFSTLLRRDLKIESCVNDFIFLCFMVGNDFLPQIPTLEILTGGIATLLDVYKETCYPFGLVNSSGDINFPVFEKFMRKLATFEEDSMKEKYRRRDKYFEDTILNAHFRENRGVRVNNQTQIECDFDAYKKEYYLSHFNESDDLEQISRDYIYGLQWVIHYYIRKIPTWDWTFPYYYAPFVSDIVDHIVSTPKVEYPITKPFEPYKQLLSVLPPSSSSLLPAPFARLMTNHDSPIIDMFPLDFEVDVSGKRAEWEGIVKLPVIDMVLFNNVYSTTKKLLSEKDAKRNVRKEPVEYIVRTDKYFEYKTPFGTLDGCNVFTRQF